MPLPTSMAAATPKLGIHRSYPAFRRVSDASRPPISQLPMSSSQSVSTTKASVLFTALIALMKWLMFWSAVLSLPWMPYCSLTSPQNVCPLRIRIMLIPGSRAASSGGGKCTRGAWRNPTAAAGVLTFCQPGCSDSSSSTCTRAPNGSRAVEADAWSAPARRFSPSSRTKATRRSLEGPGDGGAGEGGAAPAAGAGPPGARCTDRVPVPGMPETR